MLEGVHEGWGRGGRERTGEGPFDYRALFRVFDDLFARRWTEEDSERLLNQVLAKIERKRRRQRARRRLALGAALVLAIGGSFWALGSGASAARRF